MIPEQINDDGSVYFRIFVKPLVNLIWLAGIVFLLGSVDRALARCARAAAPRRALRRGRQPGQPRPRPVSIALVLGAALAVVCVVLVALPFLREPEPDSDELDELTPERRRRLALAEERDRALAALEGARGRPSRRHASTTRTIARRSGRCAARRRRRCGRLDRPTSEARRPRLTPRTGRRASPAYGGVGGRGRAAPRPG